MMGPPFRRIFVLQPELLKHGTDVRQAKAARELLELVTHAGQQGADAVYARVHGLPEQHAITLLRLLGALPHALLPQLLVPALYAKQAPHFTALHYRAGELPSRKLPGIPFTTSCHRLEEVEKASQAGFDAVFFSPVFSTASHPDTIPQGLDNLRAACANTSLPVFALGGIAPENLKMCFDAGAYGIAATRMFMR
jgi:thiamine monophosphate synthase